MSEDKPKARIFWVRPKDDDRQFMDSGYCAENLPNGNQHITREDMSVEYFQVVEISALQDAEREIERLKALFPCS